MNLEHLHSEVISEVSARLEINKLHFQSSFMTSLEIIQRVMNVPFCALESLLRQNHISEVDRTSICIDEKMLDVFADAYVRKMKNYYTNSIRHISLLTVDEKEDLNIFYKQFKRQKSNVKYLGKWENIDSDLIRETFFEQVRGLTPRQESFFERFIKCFCLRDETVDKISSDDKYQYKIDNSHLLERIKSSIFYLSRNPILKKLCEKVILCLRYKFVSARYRIYSVDDIPDSKADYNLKYIIYKF